MRVLLVDGDSRHAALAARALRSEGLKCVTSAGDDECLAALAHEQPFDVLVVASGPDDPAAWRLLRRLRRAGHVLPTIVLADPHEQRPVASLGWEGTVECLIREPDLSHLQVLPYALRRLWQAVLAARGRTAPGAWVPAPEDGYGLTLTDSLTGLYSRAFLTEATQRAYGAARRYRHALACALVDLDRFGQVNATFGHLVGDEILTKVAALLRGSFRSGDLLFRYAGEEFAVLMPHTDAVDGRRACERLLERLRAQPVPTAVGAIQVTASAGVAAYVNGNFLRPEGLLTAADCALYSAKTSGRDRVVVAEAMARPPQVVAAVA